MAHPRLSCIPCTVLCTLRALFPCSYCSARHFILDRPSHLPDGDAVYESAMGTRTLDSVSGASDDNPRGREFTYGNTIRFLFYTRSLPLFLLGVETHVREMDACGTSPRRSSVHPTCFALHSPLLSLRLFCALPSVVHNLSQAYYCSRTSQHHVRGGTLPVVL